MSVKSLWDFYSDIATSEHSNNTTVMMYNNFADLDDYTNLNYLLGNYHFFSFNYAFIYFENLSMYIYDHIFSYFQLLWFFMIFKIVQNDSSQMRYNTFYCKILLITIKLFKFHANNIMIWIVLSTYKQVLRGRGEQNRAFDQGYALKIYKEKSFVWL